MEEIKKTELFDRYLRGELDAAEQESFLRDMELDPDLESDWKTYRLIVEGIRESRRRELKEYLKKNARVRFFSAPYSTWAWASAAAVAILAAAFFVVQNGKQETTAYRAGDKKTEEKVSAREEKVLPAVPETESSAEAYPGTEEPVKKDPVVHHKADTGETEKDSGDPVSLPGNSGISYPKDEMASFSPPVASQPNENTLPVKEDEMYFDTLLHIRPILLKKDQDTLGLRTDTAAAVKISVEFWKSPINYKGYRFDGRKLALFGLRPAADFEIKAVITDQSLETIIYYLQNNGEYYLLEEGSYRSYKKQTDLKQLEKLKN